MEQRILIQLSRCQRDDLDYAEGSRVTTRGGETRRDKRDEVIYEWLVSLLAYSMLVCGEASSVVSFI